MDNNTIISGLLRQIGALLDEQGVAFKPAAYRRAAQVIAELPNDVSTYGDVKELKKLSGIGDAIAHKIIEYLETGKMEALENLRVVQGGIPTELMDIEDLGPKRIREFQKALGIKSVADLIQAAQEGKLRDLPRMSEDLERKILENAKNVKEHTKRFVRSEIQEDVESLLKEVKEIEGIEKAAVAGSFRREKETVGDIDILTVTSNPEEVSNAVAALPIIKKVAAHGDKKLSFDLQNGLRVDIRFVAADQWGSAILYFTGSKEHNIAMRRVAMKKGWKLNEYGLFDGEEVVASKEENDIYEALGLNYFEPNNRIGSL
jgi:DNA polymerase (family 10)